MNHRILWAGSLFLTIGGIISDTTRESTNSGPFIAVGFLGLLISLSIAWEELKKEAVANATPDETEKEL